MAGKKFLNPYAKVVICALGMACIAYFLYPSLISGDFTERQTIFRAMVFLGFAYLLVRSVLEIVRKSSNGPKN